MSRYASDSIYRLKMGLFLHNSITLFEELVT